MTDHPARIRNPILPGFNPDPSIVRVGDDYYIAYIHVRMVSGRSDPPLPRPRPLAPTDTPPESRQPAEHAGRPGFVRHLGALPQLRRWPLLAHLYGREAIRPHDSGRRSRRVAARHTQLPGDQPADRRRVVGSGLPQQQRLRSFAVPRRRRPEVPPQYALGPPAWMQSIFGHRVAGVLARGAQAGGAGPPDLSGHADWIYGRPPSLQAERLLLPVDRRGRHGMGSCRHHGALATN